MPSLPHGILLPKSNSGKDVTRLSAKLNVHEARAGVAEGSTQIHRHHHRNGDRDTLSGKLSRTPQRA